MKITTLRFNELCLNAIMVLLLRSSPRFRFEKATVLTHVANNELGASEESSTFTVYVKLIQCRSRIKRTFVSSPCVLL